MAKTRKTEKAVEIHEFYIIRSSGSLPPLCARCSTGNAVMVPAEQAAVVTHVPVRTIYRWVEEGIIHFQETPNNSLLVCLNSFPAAGPPSFE